MAAAGILCEKDEKTGFNIYKLRGSQKTVMFDAGQVPEAFMTDIDILVINNCSPDRMPYISGIINRNPDITLAGTAVALNFTEEFLNRRISKHIIRRRESIDIGGNIIDMLPVPNVKRSKHQDRTWKKSYKFLQIPNWQWIDSICIIAGNQKTLLSGQLFSSSENGSRKEYFKEKLRPYSAEVAKTLRLLETEDISRIFPEEGEAVDFRTGMAEYRLWTGEAGQKPCKSGGRKKRIVIPYISNFGCTKQLAEAMAAGAGSVQGTAVELIDGKAESTAEILERMECADGIVIGTPTIENDAAKEILHLLAEAPGTGWEGKTAAAFGSYSYTEKGITNILRRMEQLSMQVMPEGFAVRFKPDDDDLKAAKAFGVHFAKCTLSGELLPWKGITQTERIQPAYSDRRFIIIGNGAAGITAAEELRKLDAGCSIELISREKYESYNRQMLTRGMFQEIPAQNIFLYKDRWYEDRRIKSTLSTEVTSIDPDARQITLAGGITKQYDKLIIAAGAEPVKAEVPGMDLDGIFCIHDLAEMSFMREYIKTHEIRDAVILGGGIMSLETAAELIESGVHITILDIKPYLMSKQLDETAGKMVEEKLGNAGIEVITSALVTGFRGDDNVTGVELQSGRCLDAQLVIQCLGIKENDGLMAAAGGQPVKGTLSGIEVNERMETGIQDIYACGDCAVYKGVNYGLWTQAVEMARIAARNAAGEEARYEQVAPAVTFARFGIRVFAVGDNGRNRTAEYQSKEVYDPAEGIYKKLYFRNRKFCGGILLGDVDPAMELMRAYKESAPFETMTLS